MDTKVSIYRYCKSTNIIKYGRRKNGSKVVQIYKCKSCGKFFSETTTYEKILLKEILIRESKELRKNGWSYRKIKAHIEAIYKIRVSHVTIYYWVRKKCTQER